jgi:SAM-dependent methyltransferase
MLEYNRSPRSASTYENVTINSFIQENDSNIDHKTVESFGEEWESFHDFSESDIAQIGADYFDIISSKHINDNSLVLDVGCGSGRWGKYLSPKVKFIEAIDPSSAVYSAVKVTKGPNNIRITRAGVDLIPFPDNSFDFVFSLGVLHHIPDTRSAMQSCVDKLKPGGYFLVYLYYNLDNRGIFFRSIFQLVNIARTGIARMPSPAKKLCCNLIALTTYFPLAKTSTLLDKIGLKRLAKKLPLSYYRDKSFYIMRNYALDRFGTPLEQRFSRQKIDQMMKSCGLSDIIFSEKEPYWHAVGRKS